MLDQLSAYIDYELTDAERERVRDHLRRCPACENELATLKATKQLMTEVPLHPAPRSFILTPEMVGRGVTGPVERRRTFGWTLAGRLRTASALVAVLLVLVLSGDFLSRANFAGSTMYSTVAPPLSSTAPAPDDAVRLPNPTTAASAAATTTPMPQMLGASGAPSTEPPPPPAAGAPDTGITDAAAPTATTAAVAPLASESSPTDGLNNFDTNDNSGPYGVFSPTPVAKGVTAEASAPPPVNPWQLAEGALLIVLLVLGVGALWARVRGV